MPEPEKRTGPPGEWETDSESIAAGDSFPSILAEVRGLPHHRGAPAPADLLAHYADPKVIARYRRGRRMNRVVAIRRVQLREYFKKAA